MSLHVFQITVEVDDEALAEWIPGSETRGGPYTTKFSEWDASDLFRSADYEIIDPGECDLDYMGKADQR